MSRVTKSSDTEISGFEQPVLQKVGTGGEQTCRLVMSWLHVDGAQEVRKLSFTMQVYLIYFLQVLPVYFFVHWRLR
jgi:hypothetical protein